LKNPAIQEKFGPVQEML